MTAGAGGEAAANSGAVKGNGCAARAAACEGTKGTADICAAVGLASESLIGGGCATLAVSSVLQSPSCQDETPRAITKALNAKIQVIRFIPHTLASNHDSLCNGSAALP